MGFNICLLAFFLNILESFEEQCDNWDSKYICKNNEDFTISSDWDERGFQTPPKNDIYGKYRDTYQDMHYIVGYVQYTYSSDRNSCTLKFITKINPKLGTEGVDYYLLYTFGDVEQANNTIIITSENNTYSDGMTIIAKIMDSRRHYELLRLELEEKYFIWDNQKINQPSQYENGQKGGIVEFFGWPYEDIELECEFLSHAGYMGLKIYSPNEHLQNNNNVEDEMLNPWWYINQPVSYNLNSRMGSIKQLKKMINTCRSYNLRIYADIVINHMTGHGYDMYDDHRNGNGNDCFHWNEKGSTAGSPFWTIGFRYENNPYTGLEPGLEYPAVPYFPSDFHCKNDITNWNDAAELNGGWLSGLADLNTEKDNVQQRIITYIVELLSIGISGISIPNSKHIYPSTFATIFKKLKISLGGEFPDDFLAILQLTYGWEKQILICEKTKLSCFGEYFKEKLEENNLTDLDIQKIKIWNSGFPQEYPECNDGWKVDPERHALSIERPDDINLNSYYNIYIRDKDIETHRTRTMDMFNNIEKNWKIKSVFSMFSLINGSTGFPDGKSDCKKCKSEVCKLYCTKSFPYQKAYNPLSEGYDCGNITNWNDGTYTRVHRDLDIVNSMRQWMNLNIMTEDELYSGERKRANCSEDCLICNDESKIKNMCLICNKSNGFYPVIYPGYEQKYFECLNSSLKFERIYFDENEEAFKPCYESCRECDMEGNPENHNCLKCDVDLIERPGTGTNNSLKNCVVNCTYTYNMTSYGQYKCVERVHCTKEASYYIREKNICVDLCKKDDIYKYAYNGICLESCPDNTIENDFLCSEKKKEIEKEIEKEKEKETSDGENNVCTLSQMAMELSNFQEDGEIQNIVLSYIFQFYYKKTHVLQVKNSKYNIMVYRDRSCISELSLNIPKIDFDDCYIKVLNATNNQMDEIIILYAKKINSFYSNTTYSLFDPKTTKKIDAESICKDNWIIIEKNITFVSNQKFFNNSEMINFFLERGIDVFNLSNQFFTDVCFTFESPNKKDITLKDRILSFYPNITLCDTGCELKGLNLTTMTCTCLCRFNDILNNDLVQDVIYINENLNNLIEMIHNSNIEVLTCYKNVFTIENIKRSIGGLIIFGSLLICICFMLIFYLKDLKKVTNYILGLTENYINYLSEKSSIMDMNRDDWISGNHMILNFKKNEKEKPIISQSIKIKQNKQNKQIIISNDEKESKNIYKNIKNDDILTVNKNDPNSKELILNKRNPIDSMLNQNTKKNITIYQKKEEFFIEYLSVSMNDLDFEDSLKKDTRSFFEYLCDSIVDRQLIVNTFYSDEPLRPISIKIILFDMTLVLYFVVNGLFYSEDYISIIYYTENEQFFSFFPRSINRFVYTTLVNVTISFLIDCFFIEEKKIKGIFLREKDSVATIKFEISKLIKKLKKRYLSFVIVVFGLSICFWYYLSCFNYVYYYTQIDWIKSSVVIIIIMQIVSVVTSLAETILRFTSFYFRSEKIFRVSKLLE